MESIGISSDDMHVVDRVAILKNLFLAFIRRNR